MAKKKVTLQDLANELSISRATISMILSGHSIERFSEETVNKVREAADRLGYTKTKNVIKELPPGRCKNCSGFCSKHLMILVPDLYNPYYTSMIKGIENMARRDGHLTSVHLTYWDEKRERAYLDLAEECELTGVIYAKLPHLLDRVYEINKKIPVVAIADKRADLLISTVDMNNYAAAQSLCKLLVDYGHRKVAFISTGIENLSIGRIRRREGVEDYFTRLGENVVCYADDLNNSPTNTFFNTEYTTGYVLAKRCLREHPEVTAIVGMNDMISYGIYNALVKAGLRVPDDISLCSFDNLFASDMQNVGLTSIDNNLIECGESAYKLLMREREMIMAGVPMTNFAHIEYNYKLVERTTTGPVRKYNLIKLNKE